jgi:hypothetical protein
MHLETICDEEDEFPHIHVEKGVIVTKRGTRIELGEGGIDELLRRGLD